ncbi:hypothetical protein C8Q74DRAFT_1213996 [Fomes fomentarius]|nr:hypothetical protein C8Q74DRAFT_1213996 [Fomes fomentarius]
MSTSRRSPVEKQAGILVTSQARPVTVAQLYSFHYNEPGKISKGHGQGGLTSKRGAASRPGHRTVKDDVGDDLPIWLQGHFSVDKSLAMERPATIYLTKGDKEDQLYGGKGCSPPTAHSVTRAQQRAVRGHSIRKEEFQNAARQQRNQRTGGIGPDTDAWKHNLINSSRERPVDNRFIRYDNYVVNSRVVLQGLTHILYYGGDDTLYGRIVDQACIEATPFPEVASVSVSGIATFPPWEILGEWAARGVDYREDKDERMMTSDELLTSMSAQHVRIPRPRNFELGTQGMKMTDGYVTAGNHRTRSDTTPVNDQSWERRERGRRTG